MNLQSLPVAKKQSIEQRMGVVLRHGHYQQALLGSDTVDYVEVHSENFFAEGGLSLELLQDIHAMYPISFHSSSLGLGSVIQAPQESLDSLAQLNDRFNPMFVSDHACFCWTEDQQGLLFSGDLLPITHDSKGVQIFSENVDRVQQALGRQILVGNLSHYDGKTNHMVNEMDFLQQVCARSGCGLLVDINNLYVSSLNSGVTQAVAEVEECLDYVDGDLVGQIHLAGSTFTDIGRVVIDDHGAPVPEHVWELYQYAIQRWGPKPSLIEWDNNLPSWDTLLSECYKARLISSQQRRLCV